MALHAIKINAVAGKKILSMTIESGINSNYVYTSIQFDDGTSCILESRIDQDGWDDDYIEQSVINSEVQIAKMKGILNFEYTFD